jgi:hypothetical protein
VKPLRLVTNDDRRDAIERGEIELPPDPSPTQQTADAVVYLNAVRRGDGLTPPWSDVAPPVM